MNPMNVKRCGTCHFGKIIPQDITKRVCWGAPPTAIQMPAPRGQMMTQMTRPVVSVSDDACALYQEKDAMDKARDNDVISAVQQGNQDLFGTKQ
jgi:hypothetical protein